MKTIAILVAVFSLLLVLLVGVFLLQRKSGSDAFIARNSESNQPPQQANTPPHHQPAVDQPQPSRTPGAVATYQPQIQESVLPQSTPEQQPVVRKNPAAPTVFGEQGPVKMEDVPTGEFASQLAALNPDVRERVLKQLGTLGIPILDAHSLGVSSRGNLYYHCDFGQNSSGGAAPTNSPGPAASLSAPLLPASRASVPYRAPVPVSQPPARSSRPGSTNTLYIDFKGFVVTNTAWNDNLHQVYNCLPYDADGDPTTFNAAEQALIIETWERVAEDYKGFDINVTTVEPTLSAPPEGSHGLVCLGTQILFPTVRPSFTIEAVQECVRTRFRTKSGTTWD